MTSGAPSSCGPGDSGWCASETTRCSRIASACWSGCMKLCGTPHRSRRRLPRLPPQGGSDEETRDSRGEADHAPSPSNHAPSPLNSTPSPSKGEGWGGGAPAPPAASSGAAAPDNPTLHQGTGDGTVQANEWTVERARAYLAGMDPQIVDLFPDRLVDSELGEIPEGWGVKALRGFSNLNPESWSRTDSPPEVEYVDLANTKWGVIETTQHFPWNDAPSRAKRVLRSGDTIVGTVRPGNGSYSLVGRGGLTGSTGFAVLRPSHSHFRELIYLAATSPENIERLSHRADGAAYPAVRPEVIAETEVSIPASETGRLDRFSMAVGSILDKIEATRSESSFLTAQRNALLPKLVSGQVWVEQAQAKPSHEKPL